MTTPTTESQAEEHGAPAAGRAHHIGVTVDSLEVAAEFWQELLQVEPIWKGHLDGEHLPRITGYEGLTIDTVWLPLGGAVLELLQYHLAEGSKQGVMVETATPGSIHIGIATERLDELWQRAISLGATPISPTPVLVHKGPSAGARVAYMRDPSGVVFELLQPASS